MSNDITFPPFIRGMPEIELPISGAHGWMLQGTEQQAVFVEFAETVDVPDHQHGAQWEMPLAGRVTLRREGGTREHGPGEAFYLPPGELHGATVHAGYRAIIIFDAPDRYSPRA